MDYNLIGIGMLSGVGYAATGYFKNFSAGETFDYTKAAPAVVLGAIVGGVAGAMNMQTDAAFAFFGFWGVVGGVSNVLKGGKNIVSPATVIKK